MNLSTLNAISPVDGRYRRVTNELSKYFSEGALIKYRVFIEVEYFIALCNYNIPQLKNFDKSMFDSLRDIYKNFSENDALEIKEIEKETNHDVKAVEYFLKKKFNELNISSLKEFIHFALTSQDINNTAVPYSLKLGYTEVIKPVLEQVIYKLEIMGEELKEIVMLARTHGQPASPTSLGKEIYVFADRLKQQMKLLLTVPFSAKFGGATGNFNAHHVAYPDYDWNRFGDEFVNNILDLSRCRVTTQIEHYDNFAAFCDNMKRINTILIDFNRDIWTYISMNYFGQKIKKNEVGSSAMPHKVNPIDFENSEGNLGLANALFSHLSEKLPVSRLQRDLTDSTVTRNIGVPLSHTLIALKSLLKGMDKLVVNADVIKNDLNKNWAVVAEAIQTILRREGYPNPYEALKQLTRTGSSITKESIKAFIDQLDVDEKIKEELIKICPENYTGVFNY